MSTTCPACSAPVADGDAFCEQCGSGLTAHAVAAPSEQPAAAAGTNGRACSACGGSVLDDGFCERCGAKAPTERDHWCESPAAWIGGVCDKGIAHARNEDAMALAGLDDRSLAVLVVCDGVTSAPDSDRASLAAARAACSALVATPAADSRAAAGIISHWTDALVLACTAANGAAVGVARTLGDPPEAPSCTFVAAVLQRDVATVAWCGDSRAYWLPDSATAQPLTVDHSLGTELMQGGMTREQAEADSTFHTITRWLGADSVDSTPEVHSVQLSSPGWLLVCSDGLWNYASSPEAITAVIGEQLAAGNTEPLALAEALVRWANGRGGHDNITAALARHQPSLR
ncbi:MAG: protein phosphatase 2C domain-containing protein [Actinomycetota bacterium]|nr:protein phosphatase 2C domain-containing protein [Actinomycetota bacterium]